MPSFEEHCIQSLGRFGRGWGQVHRWLDEFAGKPPHGMRHRKFRHHEAGIEVVRRRWGEKAAAAARAHIIADLKMDLWTEYMPLPRDGQDYVAMDLF